MATVDDMASAPSVDDMASAPYGVGSPAEQANAPSGLAALASNLYQGFGGIAKRAIEASQRNVENFGSGPPEVGPVVNAALATMGGAGVVPAEANALRTGIGVSSKGPHMRTLPKFEANEAAGVPARENYSQTGWYRGGDNQPRYWLTDQGATVGGKGLSYYPYEYNNAVKTAHINSSVWENGVPRDTRLGDVWNHPELYNAYPWLKNIKVAPLDEGGSNGMYRYADQTIFAKDSVPEDLHRVLHHEAIHAIQHHEGFAPGGAPEQFLPQGFDKIYSKFEEAQALIDQDIKAVGATPSSARWVANKNPDQLTPQQLALFQKLQGAGVIDKLQRLDQMGKQAEQMQKEAFQRYLHLHGESEARDAPHIFRNPGKLPPGTIPLHVNRDLTPGRAIEVTEAAQPRLRPVEHDPFASGPKLVPVDHDPWAATR